MKDDMFDDDNDNDEKKFPPDARNTDPWTSHAASRDAELTKSEARAAVCAALFRHGPMTDDELFLRIRRWPLNSICKRRLDCDRLGWVRPSMDEHGRQLTRKTRTGSTALVWELVPNK